MPLSVMATTPTKPTIGASPGLASTSKPTWPFGQNPQSAAQTSSAFSAFDSEAPSGRDALQALLAFSAMHQQVRHRRALASRSPSFDNIRRAGDFELAEQFVLDEVLQLVAERAITITGADGLGIALAENNEIVLRASAGAIKPDVGARIQRDSAFSGACFRTAQIIRCDDTETDDRVNLAACRRLGARSMVAVPLCGRRRVIGLLEAFSQEPFGFNDSDVGSLELLAELILAALKPEDEDRFADSAQAAEVELSTVPTPPAVLEPESKPLEPESKPLPENIQEALTPSPEINQEAVNATNPASSILDDFLPAIPSRVEEGEASETASDPDAVSDAAPLAEHHPGVVLVLVLIVVAALLGGGIWWKLKNAQLGDAMVRPVHKSLQPIVPSTSTAPSSSPTTTPAAPNPQANPTPATVDGNTDIASDSVTPPAAGRLPRVTGVRHWASADSSTVALDLEDQVQYEPHRLSHPDRIYFDLHNTVLAAELEGKTIEIGDALLARVRMAQPTPGLTRVVLETRGNSNFSVSLESNPYRLVVQITKAGADTKSQVNLFPGIQPAQAEKAAFVIPPPTKDDLQLRSHIPKMRIVVDAGHGGWDLGTVGRSGLLEKDLVLEIAQRLGKLLESRLNAEVIFTRKDDSYIALDERAGMANASQADLFISVHANYSDLPSARGVETYYTSSFSAPGAKDSDTKPVDAQNTVTSASLSPADLHERIEQSRRLAASVQRSLYGTLSVQNPGLRDRGVKQASYVVLTETAMPGILAEVSFVSSPTDEQKLRRDEYREQIAEALYKGIARYSAASHGLKVASR